MADGRSQPAGPAEGVPVLLVDADDVRRVLRIDRDKRLELAVHPVDLAREQERRDVAGRERARARRLAHRRRRVRPRRGHGYREENQQPRYRRGGAWKAFLHAAPPLDCSEDSGAILLRRETRCQEKDADESRAACEALRPRAPRRSLCRRRSHTPLRGWPSRVQWGREDSNLRRLSRRFYRPLPLAARAHPRERSSAHCSLRWWRFDVIVVGAGPAGSTAAYRLAARARRCCSSTRRASRATSHAAAGSRCARCALLPFDVEPGRGGRRRPVRAPARLRARRSSARAGAARLMTQRRRLDAVPGATKAAEAGAEFRDGARGREFETGRSSSTASR